MSTITTINSTDAVKDSRAVINTNFSNLNTDKLEASALINFETSTQLNARDTANRNTDNHTNGTTNKVFTATEKTKLGNIESNADVTNALKVGASIHGTDAKTTPHNDDTVALIDSQASNVLKKLSWTNIKATLKTYFDTLYNNYTHPNHSGDVTSVADGATTIAEGAVSNAKMSGMEQARIKGRAVDAGIGPVTDLTPTQVRALINVEDGADVTDATNVGTSIHGATAKETIADTDKFAIIDTEASNVLKTSVWTLIKSTLKTYFDTLYNNYTHPNHSGDVTSVADGATTIANGAVTLAKQANMATASVVYRKTAGDGAPEVQSLATLKTDLGLTGTNSGDQDLGGKANTALDNLADVAINTSLVSDTDNTDDLGTTLKKWANLFVTTIGATATRVTKGWFTDIESTNIPTVGGTPILSSLTAPQFTTVELGHATDTTLSRVSAGVMAVEGDTIITEKVFKRVIQIQVTDPNGDAITTGDGKAILFITPELNGYNLTDADAGVTTVSSSGNPAIQIRNVTDSVDMLSTAITIDASEFTSYTAATAPVIDTSKDDVATGDRIAIDIDTAGTGAKGLTVFLTFQKP